MRTKLHVLTTPGDLLCPVSMCMVECDLICMPAHATLMYNLQHIPWYNHHVHNNSYLGYIRRGPHKSPLAGPLPSQLHTASDTAHPLAACQDIQQRALTCSSKHRQKFKLVQLQVLRITK